MVAYIDRVNVSFASLQMNDDLKFSATIYGLGGGLFFLGYALFEVPSSLMLARFSAPQWIARIMITWGLLAAGMMFVQHTAALLRHALSARRGRGRVLSERDLLLCGLVPDGLPRTGRQPDLCGELIGSRSSWARSRAACWGLTAWLACGDGNGCSSCRACPASCWA